MPSASHPHDVVGSVRSEWVFEPKPVVGQVLKTGRRSPMRCAAEWQLRRPVFIEASRLRVCYVGGLLGHFELRGQLEMVVSAVLRMGLSSGVRFIVGQGRHHLRPGLITPNDANMHVRLHILAIQVDATFHFAAQTGRIDGQAGGTIGGSKAWDGKSVYEVILTGHTYRVRRAQW